MHAPVRRVGNIATNFHAVTLSLKSVMDGNDMDQAEEPHYEQQASAMVKFFYTSLAFLCLTETRSYLALQQISLSVNIGE